MNRRSLLRGLLCGVLPAACSSETVAMWPPAPSHFRSDLPVSSALNPVTPTEKEHGLAAAYENALTAPGFGDLASIVDERAQFAFGATRTHGRDRVVKAHEAMFGAFDQRRFVANRVWLTDSTHPLDSQALEWTMTGVQARPWLGVAATLKPVVIKGLTLLWTSDAGIILDLHVYFDEEVVRAQLGSGPAELRKLPLPSADSGPSRVLERSGSLEEKANIAIARQMIQALEDGKEKEFLATMDDQVELGSSDRAAPLPGKNAQREYFRLMHSSVRHLDTVIRNVWGIQSFVVVEYDITGLQLAPLPRIPFADGSPLHTQFADIAELRDGRIVRITRYADPAAFAAL